ncbi:MAG TPA: hypothetical protein VLX64_03745, partial [Thermoplasmata archaeon]|nr:hypothetical protein [Thermoplasmata archaeon]
VVAWIRVRLPPSPAPTLLMGTAPPPLPPLDLLEPNPVSTDPRKRVFSFEEPIADEEVFRISWDADDPDLLEIELRAPSYGRRPTPDRVRAFWERTRERLRPLGDVSVEGADPRP